MLSVEVSEALDVFIAATGFRASPYFTDAVRDENIAKINAWAAANIGAASASQVGYWEIGFRSVKDQLTADPDYKKPLTLIERRILFQKLYDALASDQVRAIFENRIDSHYRPLTQEQQEVLTSIGGVPGFQQFINEGR